MPRMNKVLSGNAAGRSAEGNVPLRYELRGSSNRVAGKVVKTLVLRKAGNTNLEIIAVKGRRG